MFCKNNTPSGNKKKTPLIVNPMHFLTIEMCSFSKLYIFNALTYFVGKIYKRNNYLTDLCCIVIRGDVPNQRYKMS